MLDETKLCESTWPENSVIQVIFSLHKRQSTITVPCNRNHSYICWRKCFCSEFHYCLEFNSEKNLARRGSTGICCSQRRVSVHSSYNKCLCITHDTCVSFMALSKVSDTFLRKYWLWTKNSRNDTEQAKSLVFVLEIPRVRSWMLNGTRQKRSFIRFGLCVPCPSKYRDEDT